jgi:anti-sigma-K factor RskA
VSEDEHGSADEEAVFGALARALPRVSPPDRVLEHVLAEASRDATVIPLLERRRRRLGLVTVAAAAAVALVGVAAWTLAVRDASPDARAALVGKNDPDVSGEAELFAGDAGHVKLILHGVPPAPTGHHYEVWVLRDGETEMEPIGTFTSSSDVNLELALPGSGPYAAVDVSVEEDGGPPAHSDTSLATGTFG